MKRRKFSGAIVAVAMLAGGAGIAQGEAVDGLSFRADSQRIAAGTVNSGAGAQCRSNAHAISGGVTANRAAGRRLIGGSYPLNSDPNGVWSGYMTNPSTRGLRVSTTAVCAKRAFATGIDAVRTSADTPANSQTQQFAACPSGSRVIGGGGASAAISDPTAIVGMGPVDGPDGNTQPDDGWEVRADNLSAGSLGFIASDVACAPRDQIEATISRPSTTKRVARSGRKKVSLHCPHHGKAIGGGVFSNANYDESTVATSAPSADHGSWVVEVRNKSSAHRLDLNVYAICAR
jgi:hypothetical protein